MKAIVVFHRWRAFDPISSADSSVEVLPIADDALVLMQKIGEKKKELQEQNGCKKVVVQQIVILS